jgi:hypothetical protein
MHACILVGGDGHVTPQFRNPTISSCLPASGSVQGEGPISRKLKRLIQNICQVILILAYCHLLAL